MWSSQAFIIVPGGWLVENRFEEVGSLSLLYNRQCEKPLELVCRRNPENFGEVS